MRDPNGRVLMQFAFAAAGTLPRGGERASVASVIDLLQHASVQTYLKEHDALAAARARGMKLQRQALDAEGGVLGAQEVAALLGISRQAVDLRRAGGKLIALDLGLRKNLYPSWQFAHGAVLDGLVETLALLREEHTPPWSCLRFFLSGNARLQGDRPLDRLRRGDLAPVLAAARAFDHQGGA